MNDPNDSARLMSEAADDLLLPKVPIDPGRLTYITSDAMAAYFYNVSGDEFAAEMFPGREPGYLAEWSRKFKLGFVAVWQSLDHGNRMLLLAIAMRRHGGSACFHWRSAENDRAAERAAGTSP